MKEGKLRHQQKPMLKKKLRKLKRKNSLIIMKHSSRNNIDSCLELFSNVFFGFEKSRIVFTTTCTEEGIANWRNVTEALLKQHEVNPPYCRFAKQEGNFALNKEKTTQETIDTVK